jgi:hypothetical protein
VLKERGDVVLVYRWSIEEFEGSKSIVFRYSGCSVVLGSCFRAPWCPGVLGNTVLGRWMDVGGWLEWVPGSRGWVGMVLGC